MNDRRPQNIVNALNMRASIPFPSQTTYGIARAWIKNMFGLEFGMESVTLADGTDLVYVNRGDTYDETLCWTAARGWFLGSWGAEYQQSEIERTEETGERRCHYCGDWRGRYDVCECGNIEHLEPECVIDSARGSYVGQRLGELIHESTRGAWILEIDAEDISILLAGPDHEHYCEAWIDVVDNAVWTDGTVCRRYHTTENGDVFLILCDPDTI